MIAAPISVRLAAATAQAYHSRFETLAQMHGLWTHPLLARCQAGELNLADVRILVVQMYHFSCAFNRILASILAVCPDEASQFVIFQNLFDEMGEGNPAQSHPELFRRFIRAIGIADADLVTIPALPETQAMIDTYIGLAAKYGDLAALGAVCFASEGIVNTLYTQIYHGIQGCGPIDPADLIFFDLHINVDGDHAANLANLILPRLQSEAEAMPVQQAIAAAMDARVRFFDGILAQMNAMVPAVCLDAGAII
jgi:pyrroloquinoline-quinone synthase